MTTISAPDAGLCRSCRWHRLVTTARGQTFYLCEMSAVDPAFPKYPRLPVLSCRGYERVDPPVSRSTST
jgi:hypothetical protein